MRIVGIVLSWLLAVIFFLFFMSKAANGKPVQALLALLIVLILLPPVRTLAWQRTGLRLPVWGVAIVVLVLVGAVFLLGSLNKPSSIYKSPEVEAQLLEIYDNRLARWPVPYESVYVDTEYGPVHVVVSGPEDGPPILLLHASSVTASSWLENVGELNKHYRTYAIDTIGEPNKSVLDDLNHHPQDGEDLARLYGFIADQLGVGQADVIGASYGGFIATNYAIHAPDRVKKMALLGPMGVTPNTGNVVTKLLAYMMFPVKPFQDHMVVWAFGDRFSGDMVDYFMIVLTGVQGKYAPPMNLKPEDLQRVQASTLLFLGERDGLTGDPEAVKELAQNIPDIRIEVLDTGHLIGIEGADQVNPVLLEFLAEE